jgi:threonine/homoserine/homoserine lactone efflux protein
MTWSLAILGFFVHIDAQKDPLQALIAAGVIGVVLWFVVAQARRREARRTESRRDGTDRRPRDW